MIQFLEETKATIFVATLRQQYIFLSNLVEIFEKPHNIIEMI